MSRRIGTHEIRNPIDPQPTPEWPIENYVDWRSGARYRHEVLGSSRGGVPVIGTIVRSSGVDLYFRRRWGNSSKPRPGEIDLQLRKFIERCWTTHLRRSGKPQVQHYAPVWSGWP